jgi:hypothetical protein
MGIIVIPEEFARGNIDCKKQHGIAGIRYLIAGIAGAFCRAKH